MMEKQGGGYVVNVSSAASIMPFPQLFVYSSTKVKGRQQMCNLHALRILHLGWNAAAWIPLISVSV